MNEARHSLDRLAAATDRVLATATGMNDAQAREPSLLPGWTRGHVLSHIARNADGLGNLLRWARTGTRPPCTPAPRAGARTSRRAPGGPRRTWPRMCASPRPRSRRRRPGVPDGAWAVQVRALYGPPFPALGVLTGGCLRSRSTTWTWRRATPPATGREDFVADALPRVAGSFAGRADAPRCLLRAEGTQDLFRIGPEQAGPPPVIIHGRPADLLAWLLGRDDGGRLALATGDALPELPRGDRAARCAVW